MQQWGPETHLGGCYILVHGGSHRDVFTVESLLGPAILALNKCFVGPAAGGVQNVVGSTNVGPSNDWVLSVILRVRVVGENDSSVS